MNILLPMTVTDPHSFATCRCRSLTGIHSACKPSVLRLLLPVALWLIMGSLSAQDSIAMQTYTFKKTADADLQLDVFRPAHIQQPVPVILLFHGGSWVSGNKSQLYWQCRYFAQQGILAITANYRLLGKDTSRKDICIMDARSAVRWIKEHAAELHADTGNIILGGASAGGHIATMAVLNQSFNDPSDKNTAPVHARALVLFNPAYTLAGPPAQQPFRFDKTQLPPVIMFFGSRDKWKPAADSMRAQMIHANTICEIQVAEGETHGFFNKAPWNMATCLQAQNFLHRYGLIKQAKDIPAAGLVKD
jgi:acetyl esterase/lipase